jgi:hypothetical protein
LILAAVYRQSCQNQSETSNTATLEVFADLSPFKTSIDSAQIAGAALSISLKTMLLNKSYGYASLELSTPMPENAHLILAL